MIPAVTCSISSCGPRVRASQERVCVHGVLRCSVDINTALTARCEDGVLLNLAIVGNGAEWRDEITFWAENGVIYYRDGQVTAKLRNQEAELIPPAGPDPDNPACNFIAACLGDEPVKSPPEDALKVALFTETIWRSAQTGSPQTVAWD